MQVIFEKATGLGGERLREEDMDLLPRVGDYVDFGQGVLMVEMVRWQIGQGVKPYVYAVCR